MVCLPFAFDQFNNADNYVKKKIAVKVDLKSVTQDKLDHALNEVLSNPIYKYENNVLIIYFLNSYKFPEIIYHAKVKNVIFQRKY